jgi:hypothetical protein
MPESINALLGMPSLPTAAKTKIFAGLARNNGDACATPLAIR